MVGSVNTTGYQSYSYQQAVNPLTETRGGENRIQLAPAPASDSQRPDQRDAGSRDSNTGGKTASNSGGSSDGSRGKLLDTTA